MSGPSLEQREGLCAAVLGSWSEWRAQTRDLEKQSMPRVVAVTGPRAQLPHCQEKTRLS